MSTEQNGHEPQMRIEIQPEPSTDETEALIAAITTYLAGASAAPEPAPAKPVSRWSAAGRRAAVRAMTTGSEMGWGRRGAGWTR